MTEGFGDESAYKGEHDEDESAIGRPLEGADDAGRLAEAQSGEGDYGQRGDETDFGEQNE